jgi:hypothetical protein
MRTSRISTQDIARSGRPGELRPRAGSSADRQPEPWRAPYRRVQAELRITAARLELARRTIEAGERFLAGCRIEGEQHRRELRPLAKLDRCLKNAANRLARGQAAISESLAQVVAFPDRSADAQAALVSAQHTLVLLLEETTLLVERVRDMAAIAGAERAPGGRLWFLPLVEALPDPVTVRRGRDAAAIPAILPPYRRPLGNAVSAARRVCRGRAPPALSFRSR